jgi:predicted Zn-dependent peptidase
MYELRTLPNGARLLLVPSTGTEVTTVMVTIRVGSRDESPEIAGASHLIEHMLFKGGEKYPTAEALTLALDRYGAEFNATTSEEETEYYVDIESSHAVEAIGILADMLLTAKFEPAELQKEREVIVEEIKMYEENPQMHLSSLFSRAMFAPHTLGRDIAGSPETVRAMDRQAVIDYRDRYYLTDNLVITLGGKVDEDMVQAVETAFAGLKVGPRPAVTSVPVLNPNLEQNIVADNRPLKQTQLMLGVPMPGRANLADTAALRLLARLLGGTMSSRLFVELREKRGLCYSVSAGCRQFEDSGAFVIRAGVDSARLGEAVAALKVEWAKLVEHGVTEEELQIAKDNLAGSLAISLESPHTKADFFAGPLVFGRPLESPAERLARYRAITPADIQEVIKKYLDWSKLAVATIGPHGTTDVQKLFRV